MDALFERDPKRAADIVRQIREEHGAAVKTPETFKDAMRDVPDAVRQQFSSELLRPRTARNIDVGSHVEIPTHRSHGEVIKIYQDKALVRMASGLTDRFKLADLKLAGVRGSRSARHHSTKGSEQIHALSADQLEALRAFAEENGRSWKSKLNTAWSTGRYDDYSGTDDYGSLQQVRNRFGPAWLSRFSFDRIKTHSVQG